MNTPTLFDNINREGDGPENSSIVKRFDRHEQEIVRFLETEYGELSRHEKLAVMLTSLFICDGHVCMPVDKNVPVLLEFLDPDDLKLKDMEQGRLQLGDSKIIGKTESGKPMILDDNRLYFQRYYRQEKSVELWLDERGDADSGFKVTSDHRKLLEQLFPATEDEVNWQKVSAAMSLFKSFLIVSGGPGTGKTTTVARLLALQQRSTNRPLKIALAAPTGKAAGRMGEALFGELQKLNIPEEQLKHFPAEAQTIHRLLREVEDRGLLPPVRKKMFRYDIIVVDEASMIDLSLIHRLIQHLSNSTKLVLLGDKDQLASVEAGSVFADLCRKKKNYFHPDTLGILRKMGIQLPDIGDPVSGTDDSIVYLTKSYRFGEKSGIGRLAAMVKEGIPEIGPLSKLFGESSDIEHHNFSYSAEDFNRMNAGLRANVQEAGAIRDPEELLRFWKRSTWLTVLRRGLSGADRLNRLTEQVLATSRTVEMQNGWYHSRPVMITRNNYDLGVFNGDHGVCIRERDGIYRIYVQSGSGIKKIRPERLLHYTPAYFLTVHKSQGSEFDLVNLLLPNKDTPILTRELQYTAVTRARMMFRLYGDKNLFVRASNRATERFSGLKSRL